MLMVKAGDQFPLLTMGTMSSRYPRASLHISWGGALRGVPSHAVDEAIFCHKVKMAAFCTERVLSEKAGLNSQAFLMGQRRETRIPFPCHSSTKEMSPSVKASTQPAEPWWRICFSSLAASSSKSCLEHHLKTWESQTCTIAQAWFCLRFTSAIMRSTAAKILSLLQAE